MAWLALMAAGMNAVWSYERTPGLVGNVVEYWPTGSSIVRSEEATTLLMFAHPRCSCTRASLAELAEIVAGHGIGLEAYVVFFMPDGAGADWQGSDIVDRARHISGVRVLFDRGGGEATRFGSATSGQVLLYDRAGRLSFRGGITAARGHQGDNAGSEMLASVLAGYLGRGTRSPVFGCELLGSAQKRAERP